MIYISSDHRGFQLKEKIKEFLLKQGISFEDLGNKEYDKDDDYPDKSSRGGIWGPERSILDGACQVLSALEKKG